MKRETTQVQYNPLLLLLLLPLSAAPAASAPGLPAQMLAGDYGAPLVTDSGAPELTVLYKYVYVMHTELVLFLFASMLLACFSVVTALLLRQLAGSAVNPLYLSTAAVSKKRVFFSSKFAGGPTLAAIRA